MSEEPAPSCKSKPHGTRVEVPVSVLEFDVGGDTMWVHNADGMTVLRIKLPPGTKFAAEGGCQNLCSHLDLTILGEVAEGRQGPVTVCLAGDAESGS